MKFEELYEKKVQSQKNIEPVLAVEELSLNWFLCFQMGRTIGYVPGFSLSPLHQQICPGLNANEIQIPYDKHHKVSSLVKRHQNTHNSVKYEI